MSKTREADVLENVQVLVLEPIGAGKGTISAGEQSQEQAQELAEAARVRLVSVDPNAPSCCIDGRCAKCTMGEGEAAVTEPRPSVAGGGAITAYAAAELAGYFDADDNRASGEKLADIDSKLRSQNINSGSHCDETAAVNGFKDPNNPEISKTGCGAGDRLPEIVSDRFYDSAPEISKYSAVLMGKSYDAAYATLPPRESVVAKLKQWDSHDAVELTGKVSDGNYVEVLTGSHEEKLVVFNFVDGTTVDRDALVRETGKQVFVVDVWYINKLSGALAAGRPDAVEMEAKLRHHMVGYQVATYLTLCDGSQRPALITERQAA